MNIIKALKKLATEMGEFDPEKTNWVLEETPFEIIHYIKRGNQWYALTLVGYYVDDGVKVTEEIVSAPPKSKNIHKFYHNDTFKQHDNPHYFYVGESEISIPVSIENVLDGIDRGFKKWVAELSAETDPADDEEDYDDGPSDYSERMEERRQMGLSNF